MTELDKDDLAFGSGDDDSDDGLSIMSGSAGGSSLDSFDSDLDSDLDDDDDDDDDDNDSLDLESDSDLGSDLSEEQEPEEAYAQRRKRREDSAEKEPKNGKLPIKLPSGRIERTDEPDPSKRMAKKAVYDDSASGSEDEEAERESVEVVPAPRPNPMGPRFGRPGVKNVLEIADRKEKFEVARHEIAAISRDIMADPENSVGRLICQ